MSGELPGADELAEIVEELTGRLARAEGIMRRLLRDIDTIAPQCEWMSVVKATEFLAEDTNDQP